MTTSVGKVLVIEPSVDLPSGLIAIVTAAVVNADGTTSASITPGSPADAYNDGAIHALDTAPPAVAPAAPAAVAPAPPVGDGGRACRRAAGCCRAAGSGGDPRRRGV